MHKLSIYSPVTKMNDMVLPDGYFSIYMQPEHDDYLSNFSQPVTTRISIPAPILPPSDESFSKQDPVKESISAPQRALPLNYGMGLKIGFSILILIWVIEIIGEWNSIEDTKEQYYNPPESDEDFTYEHPVCDPEANIYDAKACQDRVFEDSIESRQINMVIEMIKVGAWGLIWASLAKTMLFANISSKVIKSELILKYKN